MPTNLQENKLKNEIKRNLNGYEKLVQHVEQMYIPQSESSEVTQQRVQLISAVFGLSREGQSCKQAFSERCSKLWDVLKDPLKAIISSEKQYIQEMDNIEREYPDVKEQVNKQLNYTMTNRPGPQIKKHNPNAVDADSAKKRTEALKNCLPKEFCQYVRGYLSQNGFIPSPPGLPIGAVFPIKDWFTTTDANFNQLHKKSDKLMAEYKILGNKNSGDHLLSGIGGQNLGAVGCACISWFRFQNAADTVYIPVLGLSGTSGLASDATKEEYDEYFSKYTRHLGLPHFIEQNVKDKATIKNIKAQQKQNERSAMDRIANLSHGQERARRWIAIYEKNRRNLIQNEEPPANQTEKMKKLSESLACWKAAVKKHDDKREKIKKQHIEHEHRPRCQKEEQDINYQMMLGRANRVIINYKLRNVLGLRNIAHQSMMSFIAHRDYQDSYIRVCDDKSSNQGIDLSIAFWHSLNCAEPAALACASSVLCQGVDIVVCFPYEGNQDAGKLRNRPKETCSWCASVEPRFRSIKTHANRTITEMVDDGDWPAEFTDMMDLITQSPLPTSKAFDSLDSGNEIHQGTIKALKGAVKNTNLSNAAYDELNMNKIGRVRSFFYMLGLLDKELISRTHQIFNFKT